MARYRTTVRRVTYGVMAVLLGLVLAACSRNEGQPDGARKLKKGSTSTETPVSSAVANEMTSDAFPKVTTSADHWLTDTPLEVEDALLKGEILLADEQRYDVLPPQRGRAEALLEAAPFVRLSPTDVRGLIGRVVSDQAVRRAIQRFAKREATRLEVEATEFEGRGLAQSAAEWRRHAQLYRQRAKAAVKRPDQPLRAYLVRAMRLSGAGLSLEWLRQGLLAVSSHRMGCSPAPASRAPVVVLLLDDLVSLAVSVDMTC